MSGSLSGQVAFEREQLHRLIEINRSLLIRFTTTPPGSTELFALAAVLHSFYNGIENIFKRISSELGDPKPGSSNWHKELLDSMINPTGRRGPIVASAALLGRLKEYLEFRHFFRHAYVFNLRWDRMKPLVLGCEETLTLLEGELDRFFAAGSESGN